jgi:hypothetical protein
MLALLAKQIVQSSYASPKLQILYDVENFFGRDSAEYCPPKHQKQASATGIGEEESPERSAIEVIEIRGENFDEIPHPQLVRVAIANNYIWMINSKMYNPTSGQ